jgi:hypothetical protein
MGWGGESQHHVAVNKAIPSLLLPAAAAIRALPFPQSHFASRTSAAFEVDDVPLQQHSCQQTEPIITLVTHFCPDGLSLIATSYSQAAGHADPCH